MARTAVGVSKRSGSIPRVFIIESLSFENESDRKFEGRLISEILRLSGSESRYVYIRTEIELNEVLDQFEDSGYRYLHFSSHGNATSLALTLDILPFSRLAELLRPVLEERRVFFSSCEVTNKQLAKSLLTGSGCYSVVGPSKAINFDRAAIFWSSFYHRMLRDEATSMKRDHIRATTSILANVFGVDIRYFSSANTKRGYREISLLDTTLSEPNE